MRVLSKQTFNKFASGLNDIMAWHLEEDLVLKLPRVFVKGEERSSCVVPGSTGARRLSPSLSACRQRAAGCAWRHSSRRDPLRCSPCLLSPLLKLPTARRGRKGKKCVAGVVCGIQSVSSRALAPEGMWGHAETRVPRTVDALWRRKYAASTRSSQQSTHHFGATPYDAIANKKAQAQHQIDNQLYKPWCCNARF